ERMGHIQLAAPVTHIWYFKGVPSRLGYLLDLAPKDLEKVIYFAAYMVTEVDEDRRHEDLPTLEARLSEKKKNLTNKRDSIINDRLQKMEEDLAELEAEGAKAETKRKVRESGEREVASYRKKADAEIDRLDKVFDTFRTLKVQDFISDENIYRELRDSYGRYFTALMGAEAIKSRLTNFDLVAESEKLQELAKFGKGQKQVRALKRLKIINAFIETEKSPAAMVLDVLPVIPPDLRPMIQLDGGRFATSDLNDLYRRVINRNTRLKKLLDLGAPEIIINNEKRMLQESVDALLDNGRRGRPVTGPGNRPLKSLSDILKGKQGRFRQNLLGKRVDYSGRSVIVVGPQLKLHQCGLPKQMALELFKPFVMKRLVDLNHAQNIKSAKRMVERQRSVVWDVLEEVITEHPVLLNRAPTLHRLGIQAFEPQLIEGKAIQIHPLVCTAFNADFDGDQMAVHVPLSAEAQAEARILMLSTNNILSPANGRPITSPTQDMVLGLYSLTREQAGAVGEGRIFSSVSEAVMAFDRHEIALQSKVKIRFTDVTPPADQTPEGWSAGDTLVLETTLGRALFNQALPDGYPFVNVEVKKSKLGEIINDLAERFPKVQVAATLDALKEAGFHWATRSGVTISFADVLAPDSKGELLAQAEEKAEKIQKQYERGLIADSERRQELIEVWTDATGKVAEAMTANFPATNPVWMMVDSGARGNMLQIRQIAGMRGLVANPKGEIVTNGGDANVSFVDTETLEIKANVPVGKRPWNMAITPDGKKLYVAGQDIGILDVEAMQSAGVTEVKVRSVLTCDSRHGTCAKCYGRSLATGKLVDIGEAVGIIAAQSIGEPGTQLTMRTFHTGGAADGGDITHGLPRVVELFEARTPKGVAPISAATGRIRIDETEKNRKIVVIPDNGDEEIAYLVPRRAKLATIDGTRDGRTLADGDTVQAGQLLLIGKPDPKEVLRIRGPRQVQIHLTDEVQEVYRSQGVSIHDKHIEVIVRQMLKRVVIVEQGDSQFLTGELVERTSYESANRQLVVEGKGTSASARPELMGITKASLATESWLSAASFQETTRVLTDAAINGRKDSLLGLKENVIIGKLIPAGTGLPEYRNVKVEPTEEAKAARYATMSTYDSYDYLDFGTGTGEAVPLDDFEFGRSNA
ncbi:MAG: DNA-directed RNA polymerase subunit beta', partial [Actinobacteria bacterium]|nr:DNA-directed RNA polymerase subunit beta' [Actinomycetota bacterium]